MIEFNIGVSAETGIGMLGFKKNKFAAIHYSTFIKSPV